MRVTRTSNGGVTDFVAGLVPGTSALRWDLPRSVVFSLSLAGLDPADLAPGSARLASFARTLAAELSLAIARHPVLLVAVRQALWSGTRFGPVIAVQNVQQQQQAGSSSTSSSSSATVDVVLQVAAPLADAPAPEQVLEVMRALPLLVADTHPRNGSLYFPALFANKVVPTVAPVPRAVFAPAPYGFAAAAAAPGGSFPPLPALLRVQAADALDGLYLVFDGDTTAPVPGSAAPSAAALLLAENAHMRAAVQAGTGSAAVLLDAAAVGWRSCERALTPATLAAMVGSASASASGGTATATAWCAWLWDRRTLWVTTFERGRLFLPSFVAGAAVEVQPDFVAAYFTASPACALGGCTSPNVTNTAR